jgi:ribosomal protein S18 acetylase RimI-like enzyme
LKGLRVRFADNVDFESILRIYNASLPPMGRDRLNRVLRYKHNLCLVCDHVVKSPLTLFPADWSRCPVEIHAAGFLIFSQGPAPGTIELINLAVDPQFRCRGIGRALLRELELKHMGEAQSIVSEVPEDHLDAQLFLRACGHRACGVIHGDRGDHYFFTRERTPVVAGARS